MLIAFTHSQIDLRMHHKTFCGFYFDIPGYAYNKNTHNLECIMLELKQLHITDEDEISKILRLSDYGRKGGIFWKVIHDTNWNKVNSKGGYIISILAKDRRKTGE